MKLFFALTLLLLMAGCASPDAGSPPVDLDRIAKVMADLQIADALGTEVPVLIRDSVKQVYFHRVLEDHQLNLDAFDSLTWIVRQEPAWIDSLYTRVGDLLAKMEAERKE
jgi:hypothetical protein